MGTFLMQCCLNNSNIRPYKFSGTGIKVYSFEQALYHFYHYWKDSIDDFDSADFINWVRYDLNLSYVASEIKKLSYEENLTNRFIKFLSIIYYFDDDELKNLEKEIFSWENRSQFEKLKEKADRFIEIGQFEKAVFLYNKALKYSENNISILNNIGIAYMKSGKYDMALDYFLSAFEKDENNLRVIFNLIEAYILNSKFIDALNFISRAEKFGENANIYYFYGEISLHNSRLLEAENYFEKSLKLEYNLQTIFKLSDIYLRLRQFEKALNFLDDFGEDNPDILIKKSEIYVENNNVPAAIRTIEKALIYEKDSVKLWSLLAKYHRLNYDLVNAEKAVLKAINIDSLSKEANFELAKIKKSQGKLKDYQNILISILDEFKKEYRYSYEVI